MKKMIQSLLAILLLTAIAIPAVKADEERAIKAEVVTTDGVAMRQAPVKTAKTLVVIPKNTKLSVTARSGDWYKVSYQKQFGWVHIDYVTKYVAPKASTNKVTTAPKNQNTSANRNAPTRFKNCTELRQYYPGGVGKGHPAYAPKHDRDKDGWACE
ncbi:excalibur calcium-binding domain-containing protein [Bacillus ndiopicus]|uniref:excalibur calcium-binding domain-containing protein n=1 Tax=Bacillus ndiopicus TaxID=1347368 RepID=UPI0005A74455